MKIEQGKYYCTADGKKVGPMKFSGFDDWPWIVTSGNGICWRDDGCPVTSGSPRLVAEWTDDPKLWRDMTPEEKGALLLAHHEGKRIQIYRALDKMWELIKSPCWSECHAYRVHPEPKREMVDLHWRKGETEMKTIDERLMELGWVASDEASNFADFIENEGAFKGIQKGLDGELWAVFEQDSCRIQSILDLAKMLNREKQL